MRRTRLAVASAALAACGVLALSACTAGAPAAEAPAEAGLRLHPVGDPGSWLDDRYAAGISAAYGTPNRVCGLAGELVVEAQTGGVAGTSVLVRETTSGAVVWQRDGVGCAEGAVFEGAVVLWGGAAAEPASLVDVASGETVRVLSLGQDFERPTILARVGELLVVRGGETIGGVGAQGVAWTVRLPSRGEVAVLGDGMLGIVDAAADRIAVVDGRSGQQVFERAPIDAQDLRWASDGFVVRVNQSDPEYAYFRLDGTEAGRTVGESQYPFVPEPRDGVVLPIADHIAAGTVVGVGADGVPALFQDERQRDFTQAGRVEELPDSIISLRALSADGSVLAFREDDGGVVLIDPHGAPIADWPSSSGELRVEAGRIVVVGVPTTYVLLPAG